MNIKGHQSDDRTGIVHKKGQPSAALQYNEILVFYTPGLESLGDHFSF